MGKIFLRRTRGDEWFMPYHLATDAKDDDLERQLGDVVIIPTVVDEGFVFGLGRGMEDYVIRTPFGSTKYHNDLTQKVYDCSVEYGKRIAESWPEHFDFVDETNGPKEIKVPFL